MKWDCSFRNRKKRRGKGRGRIFLDGALERWERLGFSEIFLGRVGTGEGKELEGVKFLSNDD